MGSPEVADLLCFVSDHEVEKDRYYAKKQRCNAEHPAQPSDADMLGLLTDEEFDALVDKLMADRP